MPDALFSSAQTSCAQEVTQDNFMKDVVEASQTQPVLVDFWAAWCGPCKQLTPLLDKAVSATEGRIKLTTLDVEKNQALAAQLGQMGLPLQSIPLVVAFWQGQVRDLFQGIKSESEIRSFIEKLLKDSGQTMPVAEQLKTATTSLQAGDFAKATNDFANVLEIEPENPEGWAGLIRCMIGMDDAEGAEDVASQAPESIANHTTITQAKAALALYKKGREAAGQLDSIKARLAKNPQDRQIQQELAVALNGAGQKEEAARILLDIIAQDREGAGQAAKTELLSFFEGWGPSDPVTLSTRRKLSSLLFS